MNETSRKWLYETLEENRSGLAARSINLGLMILIILNVVSIVASSDAGINARHTVFFKSFEIFSLIVFTIEYVVRVWISIESKEINKKHPIQSRIRYMFTPMALVDFFAIFPSYLLFLGTDLLILRMLRLVRLFKLTRYSHSMELLVTVLKAEAENIVSAIFVLVIMIVIAATGIYIVEGDIQPDEFGSIPRALWWATVTLTTVGYGDVVPITSLGRVLGIVIVITGIGMAALPAGILASGFTSEVGRRRERFKNAILIWVEDGTFSKHENSEFVDLRVELGITRTDAALMLREARAEYKRTRVTDKQTVCPECGHSLKEHP